MIANRVEDETVAIHFGDARLDRRYAKILAARGTRPQAVCVSDSESDSYGVLLEGRKATGSANWIVRACHDRASVPPESSNGPEIPGETGAIGETLRSRLLARPVPFERAVSVREREAKVPGDTRKRRRARAARTAKLEVRATAVNAVPVREVDVPAGEEPIEWLLLTDLPVGDVASVEKAIAYYAQRWTIEVYFRVLKSGCRLESRRFEAMDRF